mgnify:CR=1 FL=1
MADFARSEGVSRTPLPRHALKPVLLGITCAALILLVADFTALHTLRGAAATFDESIRTAVHSFAVPSLTGAMRITTWFGSTPVLATLVLIFALILRRGPLPSRAWLPFVAFAAAEIVAESAKLIVRRVRPHPWFGLHSSETWSFPSGHALVSTVCYLFFGAVLLGILRNRWARLLTIVLSIALPLTIGFTRVYLGVHWPTDVLSGWMAGVCVAAGLNRALSNPRDISQ